MRAPVFGPACLALALLVSAAPAAADVVARTLQVTVDFTQRYGPGEQARTSTEAKRRLDAEIAGECPRLETMSGFACLVESLTLRSDDGSGPTALKASVRFALRSRTDAARKAPRQEEFRFERRDAVPF